MNEFAASEVRLLVIGGGQMCHAILCGLRREGKELKSCHIVQPSGLRAEFLKSEFPLAVVVPSLDELCKLEFDCVLYAVKPSVFRTVAFTRSTVAMTGCIPLLVSVMAGVSIDEIESRWGPQNLSPRTAPVIRCMPNLLVGVSEGAVGYVASSRCTERDICVFRAIFQPSCPVIEAFASEDSMPIVTAVSGSGPGYVFLFIESMIDAAVKNGMPRDIARRMVLQTVKGSAEYISRENVHTAIARDRICTTGGTTIAGVEALEQSGFRGSVFSAVGAAAARAKELMK